MNCFKPGQWQVSKQLSSQQTTLVNATASAVAGTQHSPGVKRYLEEKALLTQAGRVLATSTPPPLLPPWGFPLALLSNWILLPRLQVGGKRVILPATGSSFLRRSSL